MGRASKTVCLFLLAISLLLPARAYSNSDIIINHVLTDRIIQAQDNSIYIGQVLLGFTVGRAKFYSLTQIVLEKGLHHGKVVLLDPSGKALSDMEFPNMYAQTDNTLFSMAVLWDIPFKKPGDYFIAIYLNEVKVGQYKFIVVDKVE